MTPEQKKAKINKYLDDKLEQGKMEQEADELRANRMRPKATSNVGEKMSTKKTTTKAKPKAKAKVAPKAKAAPKPKAEPKVADPNGRIARIRASKAETQERLRKALATALKSKTVTADSLMEAITKASLLVIKKPSGKAGVTG